MNSEDIQKITSRIIEIINSGDESQLTLRKIKD